MHSGRVVDWPGRSLLESLAGPVTVLCPSCGSTEHGRPSARDGFVSIARAGDLVVVALADQPVGIDIEVVAAGDDRVRAIAALTGAWSVEHWTRVEAVLKADGRGLAVDPARVQFGGDTATLEGASFVLETHAVDPAYIVTTATAAG